MTTPEATMGGTSGEEEPSEILKAARMLAEVELRDRQARAAEQQAADVRRLADQAQRIGDLLQPVLEAALAWLRAPGWVALVRHIYDGMPAWARGLAGTAAVLTILGFSSTQLLEVLRYALTYIGGAAAPAAVHAPSTDPAPQPP